MRFWGSRSPWRQCVRYLKVGSVVLVCVLCIVPLRNTLFSHFMPGAWLDHNTFRIVRTLLDNQHFPIDDPFSHTTTEREFEPIKINLSDIAKFRDKDPFVMYYQEWERLQAKAKHSSLAAQEFELLDHFKPTMSSEERAQLLFTLDVFIRTCEKFNLFYFIIEGALLGSHRHHGIVPWDDDIDIALNASNWRVAKAVLGNIPGFTLYAQGDVQWKLYLTSLPPFRDKPFKYPHLDLFFFHEDNTHVWGLTWGIKDHLLVEKKYLFPLTKVYFENFWVPAPKCVERMVISNYGGTGCKLPSYVHKTNVEHYGFQSERTACSNLHRVFAFVFREKDPSTGKIREIRKVGDRVIGNVTMSAMPDICSQ